MIIKEKDCFPEVDFFKLTESGPKSYKSSELFNGKKVILVGVPGAFTPTCAEEHVPGYIKLRDEFYQKGVDKIFVVSTNDPFVMKAWADSYETNEIEFLGDNGQLIEKLGANLDLAGLGLGIRLSRFALLIDDGLIAKIFDEDGGGLEISKAENILKSI
tara:strand:+ start:113 stop:589 length:477 start_codon:yes stop_codon:yes gene_type:complete